MCRLRGLRLRPSTHPVNDAARSLILFKYIALVASLPLSARFGTDASEGCAWGRFRKHGPQVNPSVVAAPAAPAAVELNSDAPPRAEAKKFCTPVGGVSPARSAWLVIFSVRTRPFTDFAVLLAEHNTDLTRLALSSAKQNGRG